MTRDIENAVCVKEPRAQVTAFCAGLDVEYTHMAESATGGTIVVCRTEAGAQNLLKFFGPRAHMRLHNGQC